MTAVTQTPLWRRLDVSIVVFLSLVAILLFLVANPFIRLLWESVRADGGITLQHYIDAYGHPRHLRAIVTTLYLAVVVTVLTLLIGVPLAWATSRTNMPGRTFTRVSVFGAFILPNFLGAIAWILLAGPNAGWLNRLWTTVFMTDGGPFNIYSFWGLAIIMALYAYPLVYIFTTSALDLISTEMEDAAAIHGAGKYATLLKVSLPLALPAVLAACLLVFLETIALIGTPALLAVPGGFSVITTQLMEFFQFPLRLEVAAAYSMLVVVVTALLLVIQRRVLARRGYVSVSGKGGARRPIDIGPLKWVLFAYSLFIASLTVLLPLGILLMAAFSKVWTHGFTADNLTITNFVHIFTEQSTILNALQNTFVYSLAAAIVCVVLGLAVAYVVQRRLMPFTGAVQFLSLLPIAVPGVVIAIGIYGAYSGPPFYLYGSGLIIIIAYITRFLPIAAVSSTAAMQSLNPELEDAVRILGGSRLRALRVVVAPLLKKTLLGTGILIFIIASRELSTALFLTAPDTRVASVLTLDLSEQGSYEMLAAMGILLMLMTTAAVLLGVKLAGRDFMVRRG